MEYKPVQKKNSSWTPTPVQKKGKSPGKLGHFSIQPKSNPSSAPSQEIGEYKRASADRLAANVMRGIQAKELELAEESTLQRKSESPWAPTFDPPPPLPQSPASQLKGAFAPVSQNPIQRQCADCAKEEKEQSGEAGKNLEEIGIQTKLTVGAPGDPYEQEADLVETLHATSLQVMSMSAPPDSSASVQRQLDTNHPHHPHQIWKRAQSITPVVHRQIDPPVQMRQMIQRAAQIDGNQASGDLESRLNASNGGGSPLSEDVRGFMEPRFGADFSGVRVHTGGEAVQMNRELGAQAFTHGSDVYFGAGKSPGNNELTAHEFTHVVQQKSSLQRECNNCEAEKKEATSELQTKLVERGNKDEQQVQLYKDSAGTNKTNHVSPDDPLKLAQELTITDLCPPLDRLRDRVRQLWSQEFNNPTQPDQTTFWLRLIWAEAARRYNDDTRTQDRISRDFFNSQVPKEVDILNQHLDDLIEDMDTLSNFDRKILDKLGSSDVFDRPADYQQILRIARLLEQLQEQDPQAFNRIDPIDLYTDLDTFEESIERLIQSTESSETSTDNPWGDLENDPTLTDEERERLGLLPRTTTEEKGCEKTHPGLRLCDDAGWSISETHLKFNGYNGGYTDLPFGIYKYNSFDEATNVILNHFPSLEGMLTLVDGNATASGPCVGEGVHWGYKYGTTNIYLTSITSCPCCQEPGVREDLYAILPHEELFDFSSRQSSRQSEESAVAVSLDRPFKQLTLLKPRSHSKFQVSLPV